MAGVATVSQGNGLSLILQHIVITCSFPTASWLLRVIALGSLYKCVCPMLEVAGKGFVSATSGSHC